MSKRPAAQAQSNPCEEGPQTDGLTPQTPTNQMEAEENQDARVVPHRLKFVTNDLSEEDVGASIKELGREIDAMKAKAEAEMEVEVGMHQRQIAAVNQKEEKAANIVIGQPWSWRRRKGHRRLQSHWRETSRAARID